MDLLRYIIIYLLTLLKNHYVYFFQNCNIQWVFILLEPHAMVYELSSCPYCLINLLAKF